MSINSLDTANVPGNRVEPERLTVGRQLLLSSFWFATNLHWGALLLIVVPVQAKYMVPKDSATAIAQIFGLGAIMALIVPLVAGALSDRSTSRWGRRRPYMAFGIALNLVGLGMLAYAVSVRSLPIYMLGYLVIQFGNNTAGAAYAGIIPDMVPVAQHGEASGYMAAMTQSGMILGALGSGILLSHGDYRLVFGLIGAILVGFLLLTMWTVHETPLTVAPPPLTIKGFIEGILKPLRSKDFMWVLITRALVTLGMWSVQPFIPNYLSDVVKVKSEATMAGNLVAVILIMATITGFVGGKVSDKIGRKKVVYLANALIGICSIAFVFSHSLLYTFIVGAIYGVGYGAYFSVDWALACDVLPNMDDAGKDMGVWHISMVLPQTLAPFIAGYVLSNAGGAHIIDSVKHYGVQGYQAAFGMAAVFVFLGAYLLHNVRERREREAIP